MSEIKNAFTEMLKACEKHRKVIEKSNFRQLDEITDELKNQLEIINWEEKYNINIENDQRLYNRSFVKINNYISFNKYKDAKEEKKQNVGRYISWPDDGNQPHNEWLMCVSFSTGAFIFGDDYGGQQQVFQDFFYELKTKKPDFIDTNNKCLYWKLKNASEMYTTFKDILTKYRGIHKAGLEKRRINELEKELKKLKGK